MIHSNILWNSTQITEARRKSSLSDTCALIDDNQLSLCAISIETQNMSAPASEYDFLFKILLIGDSGVGKSALLARFADNTFSETSISTIGVDFKIRTVEIDGKIIKLRIWDTSNQERFRTITSSYYRGAHGILVVFDLTDESSFHNVQMWLSEIERYTNEDVVKLLIGNKSDLVSKRAVSCVEADTYAKKMGLELLETSSKTGMNIQEMFLKLAETIQSKFTDKNTLPSVRICNEDPLYYEPSKNHSWFSNSCCS